MTIKGLSLYGIVEDFLMKANPSRWNGDNGIPPQCFSKKKYTYEIDCDHEAVMYFSKDEYLGWLYNIEFINHHTGECNGIIAGDCINSKEKILEDIMFYKYDKN